MYKLYQKKEWLFALFWILVYIVGTCIINALPWYWIENLPALIYYVMLFAIIVLWVKKHGLFKEYGFCKPAFSAKRFLFYIPLLIAVSCNLWFGIGINIENGFTWTEQAIYAVNMIYVGFLEEILFRGFLFKALAKDSVKSAVIVSSLTFGIGHLVNLVNGSGMDIVTNICQVVYAVGFGFLFAIILYRGKSIWPCIIAHSTMNVFSVIANDEAFTPTVKIITSLILTLLTLGYALILRRTLPLSEE